MFLQISVPPATKTGFCPYLGIPDDPETCLGYPSEWNLCYRAKPSAAVSLAQQRKMCLSPVYNRCPVFRSEGGAPLPKQLRGARLPLKSSRVLLLALFLILVALATWALWYYGLQGVLALLGFISF